MSTWSDMVLSAWTTEALFASYMFFFDEENLPLVKGRLFALVIRVVAEWIQSMNCLHVTRILTCECRRGQGSLANDSNTEADIILVFRAI